MIKPILWTIISIFVIVLTFMSTGGGIWAYVMIAAAAACIFMQWAVYLKKQK